MKAMTRKIAPFALAVAALCGVSATASSAQAASPFARLANHDHVSVHYSLNHDESRHFHNHRAAHRFADSMRRLGCHVTVQHNGGHYDVVYHCHGDRHIGFSCDIEAHEFESRLIGWGFNAHVHH
jgi:hypothetical protein